MRQVFEALAAAVVITVAAPAQVFQEPTPGLFLQTAKEQQFLAALASPPQLLTFEELVTGPVSSTQYAAFGVTLPTTLPAPPLAPGDCQPVVGANNPNSSAHSGTKFIGPSSTSIAVAENFTINFASGQSAVSFWIIDQEINQGAVDRIQVFGVGGQMLVNVSNLTNGFTGVYTGAPLIVALEPFVTGMPPSLSGLPSVHLSVANTIFVVGGSTPFGPPVLPAPSFNFAFVAPAGFSGLSIMMQAAVLSPATVNGLFAASHAHEIVIL